MASSTGGPPDSKKPCKGILKPSSSFDKHTTAGNRKSAKFDEINVLQTYHPPDKDYGHMKIEEPKTPYRVAEGDEDSIDQLDFELLAKKLEDATVCRSFEVSSSDEEDESPEQRIKRKEFEKRRKIHYNEFDAVRRARQLIAEEDDDDDSEGESSRTQSNYQDNNSEDNTMDVDDNNKQSTSSSLGQ
ncbi:Protein phosphatase inhibitor 2 [Pseudolycoriella hygida]|uniref:Protein phosphatase inhibitor 2 n=1 Tax=Pseudolycoriella hygida TaxID=35572 RepID=A0A9Q0MMU2_9DIPT|nr:Protein phosphatase inhibitor 2 [Pseudolycoriella hygida]